MIKSLLISLLRLYKMSLSPFVGLNCRFHPSCSQYAMDAIQELGVLKGSIKAFVRILKCNPFNPGGYDPAKKEN